MNSSSSLFSWTISSSDEEELSILFLDLEEILLQKSSYIKTKKDEKIWNKNNTPFFFW